MKTIDGPLKIIWVIAGKEVTREEATKHINEYLRVKRERQSHKKGECVYAENLHSQHSN